MVDEQKNSQTDLVAMGITDRFIISCLYNNERGDGMLFAKRFKNQFVYSKRSQQWLVWNGVHWEHDNKNLATSAVEMIAMIYNQQRIIVEAIIEEDAAAGKLVDDKNLALKKALVRRIDRLRSRRGAENCLDWAHKIGDESLAIIGDECDKRPWLLACKNGVIDLRTGFLRPGEPKDYIVTSLPIVFEDYQIYLNTGEGSPCPAWDKFISEIHQGNDELIRFIQKWIGYNLTGLTVEHYIGVFVGAGRNGKGTLFETIKAIMGDLAWSISPDMILEQKNSQNSSAASADLMSLYGKRLIIASETDEGKRVSGAKVKWLTGGDSIKARSPHDKFEINFLPSHKLNLYTNHIPKGLTKDFALQQRLLFIEYPLRYVDDIEEEMLKDPANKAVYRKKDKSLMEALKKEYSGILAWCIRGCMLWQHEGLNPPESIRANVEQLRKDEDHFGQFFTDCCDLTNPNAQIYRKELYGIFEKWFHEQKDECSPSKWGCSRQKMGEWLLKSGYVQETVGGQNIVFGIQIRPEVVFS